jgi:hypothetical protein
MSLVLKPQLKQRERIITAFIYAFFLVTIFYFFIGDVKIFDQKYDESLWFFSGFLLLIFSGYVTKEYFQKPANSIANATTVVIALLALHHKESLIFYELILSISFLVILSGLVAIFFKDSERQIRILGNVLEVKRIPFYISTFLGAPEIIFSSLYLLSTFSYFPNTVDPGFAFALAFWIMFLFIDVVGWSVLKVSIFLSKFKEKKDYLGRAVGCSSPFLYKVDIESKDCDKVKLGEIVSIQKNKQRGNGCAGMIVDKKYFLDKVQVLVFILDNYSKENQEIDEQPTIFDKENKVYKIKNDSVPDEIQETQIYKESNKLVGYVCEGSDIDKIKFILFSEANNIKEGTILETKIQNEKVLYQIINGKTEEETLKGENSHGFTVGVAKKLGNYNRDKKEILPVNWLPEMYQPVFKAFNEEEITEQDFQEISDNSIGRLPETKLQIPINDINSLVTHNTAILGVLGIGKSCLVFELIKKAVNNTNVKIICLDITNEYKEQLKKYVDPLILKKEINNNNLDKLKAGNSDGDKNNPNSWGNEKLYQKILDEELKEFFDSKKRIFLLNPDWHNVSKAGNQFNIEHKIDLTVSEKTRTISERIFIYAKNNWESLEGKKKKVNEPRFLLIFEEAHSLIPEWNSVANSKDQNASNGTAKVVLQGRKYGLGSFVITQRTANISKSVLNQCNTIFAMRVFDDTGKQFLENYIGKDYASTLPNLEERHALITGKGLNVKKPIIIELNNKRYVADQENNS